MPSRKIEVMARAIHETRSQRDPEWKGKWQDCVSEAEAADKAAQESRPVLYDASADFSHIEPI